MEKYRLVKEQKGDGEDFLESTTDFEVRITQQGKPRNYISYAMGLLVSFQFLFFSTVHRCFIVLVCLNNFMGVVGSKRTDRKPLSSRPWAEQSTKRLQ